MQASVLPVPALEKPGEHWHVKAPARLTLPVGHDVHDVAPAALKVLAAQTEPEYGTHPHDRPGQSG